MPACALVVRCDRWCSCSVGLGPTVGVHGGGRLRTPVPLWLGAKLGTLPGIWLGISAGRAGLVNRRAPGHDQSRSERPCRCRRNHSRRVCALGSERMLEAVSCHKRSRGAVGATVPTSDAVYERASDGMSEASAVGNRPGDGLSDGTHVPLEVGAKVGVWP